MISRGGGGGEWCIPKQATMDVIYHTSSYQSVVCWNHGHSCNHEPTYTHPAWKALVIIAVGARSSGQKQSWLFCELVENQIFLTISGRVEGLISTNQPMDNSGWSLSLMCKRGRVGVAWHFYDDSVF